MAKKCSYDDHPPRARRYANESVNGMGSTSIQGQMVGRNRETIGTKDIPLPGQEKPDFEYDMHHSEGSQKKGK
jgi:hypothetical protein